MFGHCFNIGISHFYNNQTLFARFLRNLIPGGTTFFVFISGYLFHHIYYKNFNYSDFFIKKLKYVFVPFLLISSTDIIYYLSRYIISIISASNKSEVYLTKLKSYPYINTLFLGRAEISPALWYIPFIMVLFALSPLFLKFPRIRKKNQLIIICILLLNSILIHRTEVKSIPGIIQNVIYFIPVYLIGIYFSINFKLLYEKLQGKTIMILFLAICIAIIQTAIINLGVNSKEWILKLEYFDLMIIQKTLLSFFFAIFLMNQVANKFKIIKLLAENSFGIFFIHGICIWIFNVIVLKLKISFESNSFLIYLVISTLILTLSLLITILIRKAIPKNSKYIIGC